jgi:phosphatidylserine decarboxylase
MSQFIFEVHKEGYKFIAIALSLAFIAMGISFGLALFFLLVTLYICYFFRDPKPSVPDGKSLVLSPAHGRVTNITYGVHLPSGLSAKGNNLYTKVSIFLSVFDVHVNRSPVYGNVVKLNYVPGRFISATLDKSSDENERQEILIETPEGNFVGVVQIAGLIARRIVCDLKENDVLASGDSFGIIRFGSRVDLYLPESYEILIRHDQTMVGGETVVAQLSALKKKNAKA